MSLLAQRRPRHLLELPFSRQSSMKVNVIGYACDLAANQVGTANGPLVLQKSEYLKPLDLEWVTMLETTEEGRQMEATNAVYDLCKKLLLQTMHQAREGHPFLVLGGDHSSAIGTWSGVSKGLQEPLGLIWFDAHMDANTPETSASQNIHGMPLAVLLGYGDKKLTTIGSGELTFLPDNVVLIGTRSFDEGEANLLKTLNVRVYFMDDIEKRGLHQVMQEAIAHVSKNTKGFAVSIDIDVIDPNEVPGVSTPEKNGLHTDELLESLTLVANSHHFIHGAEIVEFNPKNDQNRKSEKIIAQLIQILFTL